MGYYTNMPYAPVVTTDTGTGTATLDPNATISADRVVETSTKNFVNLNSGEFATFVSRMDTVENTMSTDTERAAAVTSLTAAYDTLTQTVNNAANGGTAITNLAPSSITTTDAQQFVSKVQVDTWNAITVKVDTLDTMYSLDAERIAEIANVTTAFQNLDTAQESQLVSLTTRLNTLETTVSNTTSTGTTTTSTVVNASDVVTSDAFKFVTSAQIVSFSAAASATGTNGTRISALENATPSVTIDSIQTTTSRNFVTSAQVDAWNKAISDLSTLTGVISTDAERISAISTLSSSLSAEDGSLRADITSLDGAIVALQNATTATTVTPVVILENGFHNIVDGGRYMLMGTAMSLIFPSSGRFSIQWSGVYYPTEVNITIQNCMAYNGEVQQWDCYDANAITFEYIPSHSRWLIS